MSNQEETYEIVQRGGPFSHHILKSTATRKKVFLCGCGASKNDDGTCDGSHNAKKSSNCTCEFCNRHA